MSSTNTESKMSKSEQNTNAHHNCCDTCKWHDVDGLYKFYGAKADGMGDLGFCRRYPPRPNVERLNNGEPRVNKLVFGDFPETGEDEWCGEWSERTTPAL